MKTVAATIGQTIVLIVLGIAIGVGANNVRGKDQINLGRNYFPPAPAVPTTSSAGPARGSEVPTTPTTASVAKSEFRELALDDVVKIFEDPKVDTGEYVFVDARADGPYKAGHIPGAYQCDYYRSELYLPSVLDRVQNAEKVIVYCNGGECEDSLLVCREFMNLAVPLERIYLFRGGWEAWKQAGEPFEQGEK